VHACDRGKSWYDKNGAEAREDGHLVDDCKDKTKPSPPRREKERDITWRVQITSGKGGGVEGKMN